jgi:hypothetical protein
MKLTTHLHLVPRSKNEWSYTSTPQYAFMAWCLVKAQGLRESVDWIHLAQDRDHWQALVNTIMNFCVPYEAGNLQTG